MENLNEIKVNGAEIVKPMTAVEWLERRFYFTKGQLIDIDFEKAKEIEKQHIIGAYNIGCLDIFKDQMRLGEQYYNQTFKK